MKFKSQLFAFAFIALISGCAMDDREVEHVAPLAQFKSSMNVGVAWSSSSGGGRGTSGHYLRLQHDIANGIVYTASYQGVVTASNASTGNILWKKELKRNISSGVAVLKNVVVVGTTSGAVIALNAEHGNEIWRAQVPSEVIATPRIANDRVLIKTESGDLQALDIATGRLRWSYHQNPPELMLRGGSAPTIVGNRVFAGFSDGQLVSLNLENGQLLWSRAITFPRGASAVERLVDIGSEPKVHDGIIYVVTYQGKLAALQMNTGNVIWEREMSSHVGLAVDARSVYAVDENSHVWAMDRLTGRVRWHQDQLEGRGLTQPVFQSGALVVGDNEGYLHWLSVQNGQFLVRHSVDSKRLLATPQVYGNHLVVLSSSGKLVSVHTR